MATSVVAVVAIPTIKSANSIEVELITVCVPSTNRSPLILNAPVLSPTAAGSMTISAGPVIEPTLILIPVPTAVPPNGISNNLASIKNSVFLEFFS